MIVQLAVEMGCKADKDIAQNLYMEATTVLALQSKHKDVAFSNVQVSMLTNKNYAMYLFSF